MGRGSQKVRGRGTSDLRKNEDVIDVSGIGKGAYQNIPLGDILDLIEKSDEVLLALEPLREHLTDSTRFGKNLAAWLSEIEAIRQTLDPEYAKHPHSRKALLQKLSADLISLLANISFAHQHSKDFQATETQDVASILKQTSGLISEVRTLVEPYVKQAQEAMASRQPGKMLPGDLVYWHRAVEALRVLSRSRTANSGNVWGYLADQFGSDDPQEWIDLMLQADSPFHPQTIEAIIYGAKAAERNHSARQMIHDAVGRENDLRLQARLDGKMSDTEILYLEHSLWISPDSGGLGVYFPDLNVCFAFPINNYITEYERVIVHELLHSGQMPITDDDLQAVSERLRVPVGDKEERYDIELNSASSITTYFREAYTEALALIRSRPAIYSNHAIIITTQNNGYKAHVAALLLLMDQAGVQPEDREDFLERLNSVSFQEAISLLERMAPNHLGNPLLWWVKRTKILLENTTTLRF